MAKTGVETDVSQQFRKTGVETGQQLFSLSVNQVCLNSVSTLSRKSWYGRKYQPDVENLE